MPGGSPSSGPCAAFEIIMLTGGRAHRAQISVRRFMQVPATLQRVTRFASRLDEDTETTRDRDPCRGLVGTVVPCRRQPWNVPAHERLELDGVSRRKSK